MRDKSILRRITIALCVLMLVTAFTIPVLAATAVSGLSNGDIGLSYDTTEGTGEKGYDGGLDVFPLDDFITGKEASSKIGEVTAADVIARPHDDLSKLGCFSF